MSKKRGKWMRWLGIVDEDLRGLLEWRDSFESAMRVVDSRAAPEWQQLRALLRDTYTHALAMGIRRQLKLGSRNVTIAGLLQDLAANPVQAGEAGMHASADLATLRRAAKRVEAFADRAVAHADRRSSQPLSLDELHDALTALVDVHDRYVDALDARSHLEHGWWS